MKHMQLIFGNPHSNKLTLTVISQCQFKLKGHFMTL